MIGSEALGTVGNDDVAEGMVMRWSASSALNNLRLGQYGTFGTLLGKDVHGIDLILSMNESSLDITIGVLSCPRLSNGNSFVALGQRVLPGMVIISVMTRSSLEECEKLLCDMNISMAIFGGGSSFFERILWRGFVGQGERV